MPGDPVDAHVVRLSACRTAHGTCSLLDEDGRVVATVPAPATFALAERQAVHVYLASDGSVEGWLPTGQDVGVDLRWAAAAGAPVRVVACFGPCGLLWEVVDGAALHDTVETCLECHGQLEIAAP